MTSRRQFLQMSAAAAGALPLSSQALNLTGPADAGPDPAYPFYKVIYDDRFAECRAFAREAGKYGANLHAHQGDVTDLWYNDLYHRWKEGPVAIAGFTLESHAFVLEILGRDAGLWQVYRGEHIARDSDLLEHRIKASELVVNKADDILNTRRGIGHSVSRLIAEAGDRDDRNATEYRASRPALNGAEHITLVSWVMAPMNKI
jgi:hypothetical protein